MSDDADRAAQAFDRAWRGIAERRSAGVWSHVEPGAVALVTGLPLAFFNGVWVTGDVPRSLVEELLDEVAGHGLPFVLEVRERQRQDLAPSAERLGMEFEADIPMMILDDLAGLAAASVVDGLEIRELGPEDLDQHSVVASAGFEAPTDLFRALMAAVGRAPGMRAYVGDVDGTPVTTAIAVPGPGSVGIFNVATPPSHRGHGYGGAVTAHAALGPGEPPADFAWLKSSPEGYPVYERLGFRTVEQLPTWSRQPGP